MKQPFNYEMPEDERLYREMRNKSLQGEPVQRTRKKVKINKKKFIRSMAVLLSLTVGITLGANHVAHKMSQAIQENALYGELYEEYMDEVFHPATHHVDGTVSDFYIDYDKLGDYIDESDDKDLAISLTQSAIESKNLTDDEAQMDKILAETDLGVTYDEYLQKNYSGYEDKDQFVKDTKQRIMDEAKESESEKMQKKEVEKQLEDGEKSL